MKLNKWRCCTCSFEWFEATECNNSDRNKKHGCPQGCGDTGTVIGEIECAPNRDQWICWILCKDDIDNVAGKIGIKNNKW